MAQVSEEAALGGALYILNPEHGTTCVSVPIPPFVKEFVLIEIQDLDFSLSLRFSALFDE